MAIHDWTLVDSGIFHDFHTVWLGQIRTALNDCVLPEGYYALVEQHAGRAIGDIIGLHAGPAPNESIEAALTARRRTVAIRHVSGHRLVALVEILSPGNKDRAEHLADFLNKVESALELGVHVLLVDLFPPGANDPAGIHGMVLQRLSPSEPLYDLPADEPLTLASYAAGPTIEMYLEHRAVGAELPAMPLFVRPDRYVNAPLESTYRAAYRGLPAFWRDILETP